jgi:CRP-like cAMP-binding protein
MRRSTPKFRLEQLRAIPMFAACSDRELVQVDGLVDDISVAKGAVLAHEGKPARQAFIVVSGTAKVTIEGRKIADVGPGDPVGEMALLSKPVGLRSATVTATSDMTLLVLEPRSFSSMLDMSPIARKLLGGLSDRLRETDEVAARA